MFLCPVSHFSKVFFPRLIVFMWSCEEHVKSYKCVRSTVYGLRSTVYGLQSFKWESIDGDNTIQDVWRGCMKRRLSFFLPQQMRFFLLDWSAFLIVHVHNKDRSSQCNNEMSHVGGRYKYQYPYPYTNAIIQHTDAIMQLSFGPKARPPLHYTVLNCIRLYSYIWFLSL